MSHDSFALLSEPVRRVLWEMRWTSLRPIQERAIPLVLQTENDLLISARTAAGKTEAAFLPVLSRLSDEPGGSVRAIYVGPLKALINDQFRRLEDLCRHADIPVWRWHGDVSSQQKKQLLAKPSGVLLITPESIESLFVNQSAALHALFHDLSFVVIDELHSLVDCERGTHLRSLLFRLERICQTSYRILGLSATLGDLQLSAQWMRPDNPDKVAVLEDADSQKAVRYRIFGYRRPNPRSDRIAQQLPQRDEDAAPPPEMTADLYRAFRDSKNLIFANSRADVEWFGDQLNQHATQEGLAGRFLVHHGSLSRQIREHTEQTMQEDSPCTTVCSATLELGIDIGNVTAVGQIGCPWSVGSLVQRLGRSGREEEQAHCMRLYVIEDEPDVNATLCHRLYPELLQAIALSELMLERWVEPPELDSADFSTLTQQTLSVIAETGGVSAKELFERLVTHGAFRNIERGEFAELLRSLAGGDLIEQMAGGDLILGIEGEKIVRNYDFYSAFATPPEYRVIYGSAPLGTLPVRFLPRPGDQILFAARRWLVIDLNDRRQEISVAPAKGRKKPKFQGAGGEIHPRVRAKMRDIVTGDKQIAYLNDGAAGMLREARDAVRQAGLQSHSVLAMAKSNALWFTWTGTRTHRTLSLMARHAGLDCTDHDGLAFEFSLPSDELFKILGGIAAQPPTPAELAVLQEPKQRRKYDEFVDEHLLSLGIAREMLDIRGALQVIEGILRGHSRPMPT